jgi:hypothetical protein
MKKIYQFSKERKIIDKEYERAQKIWNFFKCEILKDYLEIYLICDVLKLADVFEAFRDMSLKHYKLDPSNYT